MTRGHLVAAVVVACLGLVGSVWLCWHLHRSARKGMIADFRHQARQQADTIRDAIKDRLFVLDSIRFFYDASVYVDRDEFATACTPWLGRLPDLRQLAWIPHVEHDERQGLEIKAREDGLERFQFVEPDEQGGYRRAQARDDYYPVYYAEPYGPNAAELGRDLARDPEAWPPLAQARDSGRLTAAPPLVLSDGHRESICLQVYAPTYKADGLTHSVRARRESLRGLVRGTFSVDKLVMGDRASVPDGLLDIELVDVTDPSQPQRLYSNVAGPAPSKDPGPRWEWPAPGLPNLDTAFDVGGRRWALYCAPSEEFVRQRDSLTPWVALAAGLILTGLLSVWLLTLALHTTRVERVVDQRTAKLRQSQESLRQQEALLSKVVGNIPYYVFWKDRDLRFLGCNESFARVAGVESPADIVGKTDFDLAWKREEAEWYQRCDRQVVETGQAMLDVEESQLQADGKEAVLRTSKVPLRDQDGNILGLLGIFADITEHKRDQERLEALQKALDDASDAIAIVNKDGRVTYINVAFQEQFCATLDILNEVGWRSIFVDESVPDSCFETVMELDNWADEAELVSREGRRFPAELRCTPILDAVLMPTGMLMFVRDITDRKRAERELREHAENMEALNVQLQNAYAEAEQARENAEAANSELTFAHVEAQEARLKAERAREELEKAQQQLVDASHKAGMAEVATGVLHNVGNVLNSVNVSASLMVEHVSKSKVANLGKAAGLLQENAERVGEFLTSDPRGQQLPAYLLKLAEHLEAEQNALVNELQELTRNVDHIRDIVGTQQSYAGTLAVIQSFPLERVIEDALRMSGSTFERHRISVVREFAELPPLTADRQKVLQILINLISNAKHALRDCDRAGRRLTVRISRPDESTARVEVIDNGVGIPAENLKKLFTHGFTTKPEGHGFGLHHSALLAQQMGGSLRAHSDGAGEGAAFVLELPLEPSEDKT